MINFVLSTYSVKGVSLPEGSPKTLKDVALFLSTFTYLEDTSLTITHRTVWDLEMTELKQPSRRTVSLNWALCKVRIL